MEEISSEWLRWLRKYVAVAEEESLEVDKKDVADLHFEVMPKVK